MNRVHAQHPRFCFGPHFHCGWDVGAWSSVFGGCGKAGYFKICQFEGSAFLSDRHRPLTNFAEELKASTQKFECAIKPFMAICLSHKNSNHNATWWLICKYIFRRLFIIFYHTKYVGEGTMSISNSVGSNTFDVLMCLGLPWLIRASLIASDPGQNYIQINSGGFKFTVMILIVSIFLMYGMLAVNKFSLDKKIGLIFLSMYVLCIALAALLELNVFVELNLPSC